MSFWEEIKDKASIDEVVSEYIEIKQSGVNFTCPCPFHQEKTPSFMISPEKQIYHCFGCGVGGDIFEFVSQVEGISRFEAAKKLAKKNNVVIPEIKKKKLTHEEKQQQSQQESELDRGKKVLSWTAQIYHQVLLKILKDGDNPITQYCRKRNLSQEIIEKFKLGYAPKSNFLTSLAKTYKIDQDILIKTGIAKTNDSGYINDKFSDRLTVPIFDQYDNVVGFTARVLPYDKTERPKYLNSPASQWFDKSKTWYGLNFHNKEIRKKHIAIIVEGNMDVIAASQKGINYALASQGTAFTPEQLKMLKRTTTNIDLAFDNDKAGVIAAKKFYKESTKVNLNVKKLIIPEPHKDLDDYLNSKEWTGEYTTKNFLDYIIDLSHLDLTNNNTEIQKKSVLDFLDVLSVNDEITKEQYLQKIYKITGISTSVLSKFLSSIKTTQYNPNKIVETAKKPQNNNKSNTIRTNLQQIVAFSIFFDDFEKVGDYSTVDSVFRLAQTILPEVAVYDDLSEYITSQEQQLSLVWANTKSPSVDQALFVLKSMDSMLSSHIDKFLMSEYLNQTYLNYKKSLKI